MKDNRDRDRSNSGKKQFSRPGGGNKSGFSAKSGDFKRSDRNSYPKRPYNSNNSVRPDRTNRTDRPQRTDRTGTERTERFDKFNKFGNKSNYSSYSSRNNNGNTGNNRSGGFNKFKKPDRPDRFERGNRDNREGRDNRFDRNKNFDRKPKFDRTKSFDKPAKPEPVIATVEQEDSGMVYGRNAVIELLKSGKPIDKLFVQSGQREGSITMIFAEAVKKSIPVIETEKIKLDSMINNSAHQGVIAMASEKEYCSVEDILKIAEERNEKPFILIADKIMDPHNLGAIIRTAECAGVHGIVIPKRHAAGVSPIVAKTSAGASIHMAIAKVANIASTIEELQEKGLWVFASALDLDNKNDKEEKEIKDYGEADYSMPLALVVGNEGEGLSLIVTQKSDFLVRIPLLGKIESLNVSCASAVLMYEVSRQRKLK